MKQHLIQGEQKLSQVLDNSRRNAATVWGLAPTKNFTNHSQSRRFYQLFASFFSSQQKTQTILTFCRLQVSLLKAAIISLAHQRPYYRPCTFMLFNSRMHSGLPLAQTENQIREPFKLARVLFRALQFWLTSHPKQPFGQPVQGKPLRKVMVP